MDANKRRRRGRPKNSKKVPEDLHQNIWVAVGCQRWRMRDSSGRRGNISQACRALTNRGGVNSIVGGNTRLLSRAIRNKKLPQPLKKLRRVDLEKKSGRIRLVRAPLGVIFLQHSVKKWTSLRARYNEAARMVRDNAELKRFWTNILRQHIGLPPLTRGDI
jgi:hypothetical protein